MSKISKIVAENQTEKELRLGETEVNYMGGDSYIINPLDTLKMITASSIFGEMQYYVPSTISKDTGRGLNKHTYIVHELVKESSLFTDLGETTEDIMINAIDKALDYDFIGTVEWAVKLRNEYYIRLNPQIIMVRAAMHPKRKEINAKFPGWFRKKEQEVMYRADDALSQMAYYLFNNGSKNSMPSILKRSWADKLSSLGAYQLNKYKNAEIGMINGVRLCHAHSPYIDELMRDRLTVEDSESTWEQLRSSGMSWKEIFSSTKLGHMAMLRNLINFFEEVDDLQLCQDYANKLIAGVPGGKQFPFRYYSAYRTIIDGRIRKDVHGNTRIVPVNLHYKQLALDTLEECIDKAVDMMPKMHGRVAILSDNSASAWGALNSEYGKTTIAEIDNLSAVLTAARSDYGVVYKFGDRIRVFEISKRTGLLKQAMQISNDRYDDVGGSTECGVWLFFDNAIKSKEHWDSIFIYSDQQAGHGGLYGTDAAVKDYWDNYGYRNPRSSYIRYINVFKLIQDYRKKVFGKVNVFSVQTAGYTNNVIPEYAYRTNIMYGWTGKETVFADAMIKQWDAIEARK